MHSRCQTFDAHFSCRVVKGERSHHTLDLQLVLVDDGEDSGCTFGGLFIAALLDWKDDRIPLKKQTRPGQLKNEILVGMCKLGTDFERPHLVPTCAETPE